MKSSRGYLSSNFDANHCCALKWNKWKIKKNEKNIYVNYIPLGWFNHSFFFSTWNAATGSARHIVNSNINNKRIPHIFTPKQFPHKVLFVFFCSQLVAFKRHFESFKWKQDNDSADSWLRISVFIYLCLPLFYLFLLNNRWKTKIEWTLNIFRFILYFIYKSYNLILKSLYFHVLFYWIISYSFYSFFCYQIFRKVKAIFRKRWKE